MIYHDINFEFHRYISMAARLQEVDSRVLKVSQSALESVGSPWCTSTLETAIELGLPLKYSLRTIGDHWNHWIVNWKPLGASSLW
jgi:hypothetical protein